MSAIGGAVAVLFVLLANSSAFAMQAPLDCANTTESSVVEMVRDRTTRVPLVGATVNASWEGNTQELRVRTDSTGSVRLCVKPDRNVTLRVSYDNVRTTTTVAPLGATTHHVSTLDIQGYFVRGTVIEKSSGTPLKNIAVRFARTPLITFTNDQGRFMFERVPVGDYTMQIEHIAFAPVAATVNVRSDDLDANVQLTPAAIPLEPVIVTAFSRKLDRTGFYDRQRRGVGKFLNRKQIDAMNVQRASDLLRDIPSARIIPQPSRRNAPPNLTYGRGQCRYKFLVDGAPTLADFEMDFFIPSAIEGVEVYSGLAEVPAVFRAIATSDYGSPLCGLIAIWTREGR